jgi:hypothetical protein
VYNSKKIKKDKTLKNFIKLSLFVASTLFVTTTFSGCGAATTAIEKRNLEVQTKMSESIFLEPVAPQKQIVLSFEYYKEYLQPNL